MTGVNTFDKNNIVILFSILPNQNAMIMAKNDEAK